MTLKFNKNFFCIVRMVVLKIGKLKKNIHGTERKVKKKEKAGG